MKIKEARNRAKKGSIVIALLGLLLLISQGMASTEGSDLSSSALTVKAWEALSKDNYKDVSLYADKCVTLYNDEAINQQRSLRKFPGAGEVKNYETLNNVATCLFIKGEALFQQKRYEEAKPYYRTVIDNYGFAQYWDPKGWYWKVAEKSRVVLNKIEIILKPELKKVQEEEISLIEGLNFPLFDEGGEDIVDYAKYGKFENAGTLEYKYKISDRKGLSTAVGEGIFPNNTVYRDPIYNDSTHIFTTS